MSKFPWPSATWGGAVKSELRGRLQAVAASKVAFPLVEKSAPHIHLPVKVNGVVVWIASPEVSVKNEFNFLGAHLVDANEIGLSLLNLEFRFRCGRGDGVLERESVEASQ